MTMLSEPRSPDPRGALWTGSMRLLIIEDDRDAAAYLVKAFRETGHVADCAHDGLDGYALAREGAYDVLIVDRMLPKLDGLSLPARAEGGDTGPDPVGAGSGR
jgi:two-component system, OmpR family, response regulator